MSFASAKKKALKERKTLPIEKASEIFDDLTDSEVNQAKSEGRFLVIDKHNIIPDPDQPRRAFDIDKLNLLQSKIETDGQIQPVVVKQTSNGNYMLIVGERRYRAIMQSSKVHTIDCVVTSRFSDHPKDPTPDERLSRLLYQRSENADREPLSLLEEISVCKEIVELEKSIGGNNKTAAKKLGMTPGNLSKLLALFEMDEDVKTMMKVTSDYQTIYEVQRAHKMDAGVTQQFIERARNGMVEDLRKEAMSLRKRLSSQASRHDQPTSSEVKPVLKDSISVCAENGKTLIKATNTPGGGIAIKIEPEAIATSEQEFEQLFGQLKAQLTKSIAKRGGHC